ncbi:MAG TPA: cysteine desulfurase family protein [Symbiobacteriaceae bacterium]|jgi:cysteine desulfurase
MKLPIYLDYNATTPVDPAIAEVIHPYLHDLFGNASSAHAYGFQAKNAVDYARSEVAALLGCAADEVIFTASGSEGNNLAVKGVAFAHAERGRHLITTQVEHPAVLNTCRYLETRHGFAVTYLPVDGDGLVNPTDVARAVRPDTTLISVMTANNETGTVQPIREISAVARERGILFHTDAAQAVGKIPLQVDDLGVDLLTVVGHKMYAPKGVGALFVRRGVKLDSLIHGASHEVGRRAGTENVPYVVGLGKACAIARMNLPEESRRLQSLRDRLHEALLAGVPGLRLNGHASFRLPNTLNVSFPGTAGYDMLARAREVAASTGSACHSGRPEVSPVLAAMGVPPEWALGAVRLSVGRWTTGEEVDLAARMLVDAFASREDS